VHHPIEARLNSRIPVVMGSRPGSERFPRLPPGWGGPKEGYIGRRTLSTRSTRSTLSSDDDEVDTHEELGPAVALARHVRPNREKELVPPLDLSHASSDLVLAAVMLVALTAA